ncbi:MAG TPA: V-type ATP synthase subunit F [Verrucomicrobiae bacterium]|nr:V-type ATP synthase subunit F [Verrucomicrobiae bacterium]
MKFCCIADERTVRGFRLAGIAGQVVTTATQAAAALDKAAEEPDCGVILVSQRVAAGIRHHVERIQLERERPLIVEIPGPEGPVPGRRSLRELVQEAVGIRVN